MGLHWRRQLGCIGVVGGVAFASLVRYRYCCRWGGVAGGVALSLSLGLGFSWRGGVALSLVVGLGCCRWGCVCIVGEVVG